MGTGPFGMEDSEFWADPYTKLDDVAWERVGNGIEGVVIDGPDFVDVDTRTTLPLVSYYSAANTHLHRWPYAGNALVILMDADNNIFRATRVPPPDNAIPAEGEAPSGFSGSEYLMDVRGELGLPWQSGNYLATVIMRDQVSNRKKITLGRSPGAYRDPEVEKLLAEERQKRPPRIIIPHVENDLVAFRRKKVESPDLPEGQGIVVCAARAVIRGNKAESMLYACLRVAIPPHDIVRVIDGDKPADVGDSDAKAIIGATLVAVGSDISSLTILPIAIPSYLEIEGTPEEPIAIGYFSLDLLKIEQIANTAQTYFIYVFAGAEMTGPVLCAVVDKER